MARPKKANGHTAPTKIRAPAKKKNGAAPEPLFGAPADDDPMFADDFVDDPAAEATTIDVAVATLSGDIRDFILDRLRREQDRRPWDQRSEASQKETVASVEAAVVTVLRKAVELIAGQGRSTIKAKLEKVTVKDGITAQLILGRFDQRRHNLIDATGAAVLIVVADAKEYVGERAPAAVKPDQASLLGDVEVVHSAPDNAHPFA